MVLEGKTGIGSDSHLGGSINDKSQFSSNMSNNSNMSNLSSNVNNNNANRSLDAETAEVLKREAWLSPDVTRRRLVPIANGVAKEELYPQFSPNPRSEPTLGNPVNDELPKNFYKINQILEASSSPPENLAPLFRDRISDKAFLNSDRDLQYSSENLTITDFQKRPGSVTTEENYENTGCSTIWVSSASNLVIFGPF